MSSSPSLLHLVAGPPRPTHPIGWELLFGVALAVWCVGYAARIRDRKSFSRTSSLVLPNAATWKFTDSWATNLTAVVAAVGAIGAAVADKFQDVVATRSVLEFGVGSALLGVLAVLAPVAYVALSLDPKETGVGEANAAGPRSVASTSPNEESIDSEVAGVRSVASTSTAGAFPDDRSTTSPAAGTTAAWAAPNGSGWGLLAAAVLTLAASFGSLVGVVVLMIGAHLEWPTRVAISLGCLLAAGLIARYAIRTLQIIFDAAPSSRQDFDEPAAAKLAGVTGIFNVSCCGSAPEATRIRVSLL